MSPKRNASIGLIILLLLAGWGSLRLFAATGTLMPSPYQTLFDANGNPVNNGKVCTYLAGSATPVATYTDVNLSVANANPIRTDSAGRYVVYLTPGVSYKFVYQDSTGTAGNCDGATVVAAKDNVSAVPTTSNNVDIPGTAGETLTAGQAVYLSDGSGGKNAGQWYKADSTNGYSSSLPEIGMAPSTIASGVAGVIRITGQMTGLTSLTIGSTYYVSTTGGITLTAPVNRRAIGVADSTTTLVLTPNPALAIQQWVDDFRLTLTTATPITTSDVTAATTIYASPLTGNRIDLPDSGGGPVRVTSTEFSIAVPATTATVYSIWAYSNAGVATLELQAWTNATTPGAAAPVRTTNGRYLKSGDNTRLFLGAVETTTVSGQTEDSATKRLLWNYYNRVRRPLQRYESTASWTYTTATVRQANGSTSNQVDVLIGIAEASLDLSLTVLVGQAGGSPTISAGIGEDATTTYTVGDTHLLTSGTTATATVSARLVKYPAIGRHFYSWNEFSTVSGTTTWYGAVAAVGSTITNGLSGWIEG